MRRFNDPVPPPLPGPQKSPEFVYLIVALSRLEGHIMVTDDEYRRALNTPYELNIIPEQGGKSTVISVRKTARPTPESVGQDLF